MISINNITKKFDDVTALNNINLNINKDELFGLIGPDGAGKTTLMRLITTLLLPNSGTITVNQLDTNKDYKKIRNMIGYMPGQFSLYMDLTVEENLKFYANIFGTTLKENSYLVKDIYSQIEPFKDRRAGQLSGGMKQKLALSCALIHRPEILILDEPTTGVDAVSRKEFWQMLKNVQKTGITIVVSTPYMDEASMCDRVALMQKGEMLNLDTPKNVVASFPKKLYGIHTTQQYKIIEALKKLDIAESVFPFGQYIHVTLTNDTKYSINDINNYILDKDFKDVEIKEIAPTIEDVFMHNM